MPRAFDEREKVLIQERLLDQGYKQFSAHGLRRVTVEDIASAAGISKGAFYHFYESKEALFLAAAEVAEQRFRQEVLAAIDRPGPSPRARMAAVWRTAVSLFETVPILRSLTGGDFELLLRRLPPEKLQAHLASDQGFFEELIARCRRAGIPIRARVEEIRGLLYALVLVLLRDDALAGELGGVGNVLVELIAAFCVGEIDVPGQLPALVPDSEEGTLR